MRKKLLVFLILISLSALVFSPQLPVTGRCNSSEDLATTPTRNPFTHSPGIFHSGSQTKKITRIVFQDSQSFSVVEQPANDPGFVSREENTLTRFRIADHYGSTGLLAHNYLAGAKFFDLSVGDKIELIGEGGYIQNYWIFAIKEFRAETPLSPYSDFIDLHTGQVYSASELFLEIYGQEGLLILQTCLDKDGVESWGRVFLMAFPTSAVFYKPWSE